MISTVRNLVLEGGGVLGAAEAGAYLELEAAGILGQLKRIAGTSAGSILATVLAMGASSSYLQDLVRRTPFRTFKDAYPGLVSWRFLRRYGVYKGDAFLRWFEGVLDELRPGGAGLTFRDLEALSCLDLYVVAYNLDRGRTVSFCAAGTPDVRIADAVRASMSIPLFFAGAWIKGELHVDGGVARNYPVRLFDTDGPNPETLGIRVDSAAERGEYRHDRPVRNLIGYSVRLITALHEASSGAHLEPQDWARTVWCDSCGIPATKFNLTFAEVDLLVESGRQGAREWLKWKREQAA